MDFIEEPFYVAATKKYIQAKCASGWQFQSIKIQYLCLNVKILCFRPAFDANGYSDRSGNGGLWS